MICFPRQLPFFNTSCPIFAKSNASGDFVMAHGRFTGFGPKPLIAVDIFRIQDGKLVEHWDVLQEEVPAEQTASKNPMFPTH